MIPLNEFTETLIGEEPHAGEQCVLIRIAGCNLDCRWCDTPDREKIIERVETDELADRAVKTGRPWALVTGGEPMNPGKKSVNLWGLSWSGVMMSSGSPSRRDPEVLPGY